MLLIGNDSAPHEKPVGLRKIVIMVPGWKIVSDTKQAAVELTAAVLSQCQLFLLV